MNLDQLLEAMRQSWNAPRLTDFDAAIAGWVAAQYADGKQAQVPAAFLADCVHQLSRDLLVLAHDLAAEEEDCD